MMDVFSRLMMDRVIFLGTEIDDYVSNVITAQLLFLDNLEVKNGEDIHMYINSPGGTVYDGNSILDMMDMVKEKCDIATVCTGLAASMSAVILSHGTKEKRCALKRSRIMIHQPIGGAFGQASDIVIEAKEIIRIKKELSTTLAENTGQSYKKVLKDTDRDNWLTSIQAKKYGIIDKII